MYEIEVTKSARKDLKKLDQALRNKVGTAIDALSSDPHPPGSRKMIGSEGLFHIRVGDCRVLYTVRNEVLTVFIIKVGDRKDIYRQK